MIGNSSKSTSFPTIPYDTLPSPPLPELMVGGESRVEVAGGECWVEVYGGESSLLWLGERPGAREALEGRRVVLVVPGNPGLAAFYQVLAGWWPGDAG